MRTTGSRSWFVQREFSRLLFFVGSLKEHNEICKKRKIMKTSTETTTLINCYTMLCVAAAFFLRFLVVVVSLACDEC